MNIFMDFLMRICVFFREMSWWLEMCGGLVQFPPFCFSLLFGRPLFCFVGDRCKIMPNEAPEGKKQELCPFLSEKQPEETKKRRLELTAAGSKSQVVVLIFRAKNKRCRGEKAVKRGVWDSFVQSYPSFVVDIFHHRSSSPLLFSSWMDPGQIHQKVSLIIFNSASQSLCSAVRLSPYFSFDIMN